MNNNDFWLAQEDMKKWSNPEENVEEIKMKNKELRELKEKIEKIEISYDYEDTYNKLYNTTIDYMNEIQDFSLEYLFEDFIDYELAEERATYELNNGGLQRLQIYLGDTNFYNESIFKIDGYGNLHNIHQEELQYLKDEIIYSINNELEKNI